MKKAGCILINKVNKEIALICRKGEYSFPKGHLKKGENLQSCAIRETREETGHNCHLIDEKEIAVIYYNDSRGNEVENYFYIAIDDGKTNMIIKEKDREITVWKKYSDVEETLSHENLKEFWKEIKEKVGDLI